MVHTNIGKRQLLAQLSITNATAAMANMLAGLDLLSMLHSVCGSVRRLARKSFVAHQNVIRRGGGAEIQPTRLASAAFFNAPSSCLATLGCPTSLHLTERPPKAHREPRGPQRYNHIWTQKGWNAFEKQTLRLVHTFASFIFYSLCKVAGNAFGKHAVKLQSSHKGDIHFIKNHKKSALLLSHLNYRKSLTVCIDMWWGSKQHRE